MDPILNPYTPGAGSRPPELAGRDEELQNFKILLQRLLRGKPQKSMIITGLRGVGKTVLLNSFNDIAEQQGFKTEKIEITHETNFRFLMARIFRRLILSLNSVKKLQDQAQQALRVLSSFTIKTPEGAEISLDAEALAGRGDSGILEEDLTDLFIASAQAAKAHHTGIVILIDEIQFLHKSDLEALISALHQVIQKNLPLTLVGAGLPQIPSLTGEAKSYSERLFSYPRIGKLEEDSAKKALLVPAKKENADFEKKAINSIVKFTEGYPYFLQEYGQHVWNIASGTTITNKDVSNARNKVTSTLDENFFRVRAGRSTKKELLYMSAMAKLGEGSHKSYDIAEVLGGNSSDFSLIRSRLINKGLIYSPEYGYTAFTVPKYDDYMRRHYSFEQLQEER